jgi:signal transduction histidine kinase
MDAITAFFTGHLVYVYFFYGLAFFSMGLVVLLESGRASEFRFARALLPLALFGLLHGAHEWYEMFDLFAAANGHIPGVGEEAVRVALLASSFLCLVAFGARLLPRAEQRSLSGLQLVLLLGIIWLVTVGIVYLLYRPPAKPLLVAADVLSRYCLAIPGALLAAWALLRERRDFHARGMSRYGQGLLWAALAFLIYGVVGQIFTRTSLVFPSQTLNSTLFLSTFGIPVQVLRGLAAIAIAFTLGAALRAFEQESRIRLARANKLRLEAQKDALEAQERRANEVEMLNVQLQATAQELSAMVEMARILTSTMDLGRLLQSSLERIVHSFEGARCSLVSLRQLDGRLKLAGVYHQAGAPEQNTDLELIAAAAKAVESEGPVGAGWDGQFGLLGADSFASGRSYRTLGVPLRAQKRTLGGLALAALWRETPLRAEQLNLLNAFAQQIATSVENAQLYGMLQQREGELEDLVRQLVNAQEGERQRIARELHDETGQKLTALAMGLAAVEANLSSLRDAAQPLLDASQPAGGPPGDKQAVQQGLGRVLQAQGSAASQVRNLRGVVDQAIVELRKVMTNLRPSQLDDLGLVPTLRWYLKEHAERHPELQVNLEAGQLSRRLPSNAETVLFRVVQEALSNVVRHAQATEVTLTLTQGQNSVRLEVKDNGVGFDAGAIAKPAEAARASGWGLVGMRERVALVGGQFTIQSQLSHGTRVIVELPLQTTGRSE